MARARSELPKRVGLRLRGLRKERNLTQEQVAERAGFSGKYVSEIERGLRDPSLTTLERVAERGIGCGVEEAFASMGTRRVQNDGQASAELGQSALPPSIRAVATQIANLPTEAARRRVMRILREILGLLRE